MNKEFAAILKQLSKEDRKIIKKMQHYFETCYLNEVVFEDMMCDIAGMALECQTRGESFSEYIGTDYKTFCRSLAGNAKKQTFPERIFDVLRWMIYFDGIIIPFLYVLYAIIGFTAPKLDGLVLTAPVAQLFMYFSVSTLLVLGWFLVKRFTYYSQTVVFAIYMAAVISVFLVTDFFGTMWFGDMTVSVSIIIWGVVIFALLTICYLAKRLIAMSNVYSRKK